MRWEGTRWQADDTLAVFDSARAVCRAAAKSANPRLAKELTSAKTVAAVERLARSDRRLAATADQWDADPWLLNTPKGVIDLRTGSMREHRARDYLTHVTAVAPARAIARCGANSSPASPPATRRCSSICNACADTP